MAEHPRLKTTLTILGTTMISKIKAFFSGWDNLSWVKVFLGLSAISVVIDWIVGRPSDASGFSLGLWLGVYYIITEIRELKK